MPDRAPPAAGFDEVQPDLKSGHRERVRERFNRVGEDGFSDAELLEAILHAALPRRDTKDLAKLLLLRFGSFSAVLSAPRERLEEFRDLGPTSITTLKYVLAAARRYARDKIDHEQVVLGSWTALIDYCRAQMAYEDREQFRILFLDKKNKLIADEVQQRGTVDHTPVYPREVIRRALEHSATAVILVHNHPSGDPTPSTADVQMTRQIVDVAKPLGIMVHDHVIVGKDGHVSMKGLKLI